MSITAYDQSVGRMSHMLKNLDAIVLRAETYANEKNIEPATLLHARLYPTMRDFVFQVQVTTDIAKGCAARLSGMDVPKWPDNEKSFADVHARIRKALDFLASVKPEQFEGCEDLDLELKLGSHQVKFSGESYLLGFVLPNFYFHLTTAYNIMRHNGLDLSKRDFLGEI